VRHRFAAMGTEVEAVLPAGNAGAAARVERLFGEWERRLSRFRPASDLARLNAANGRPVPVGPLLHAVLRQALGAAEATDGVFDPCLGRQLEDAGYAGSFADRAAWPAAADAPPEPGGAWKDVSVDADGRVRLPAGVRLDLGGIAKGMAVDAALEVLAIAGAPAALVSAGGDLAVLGALPGGDGWPVQVDGPDRPVTVELRVGALATSSTRRRRWRAGDELRHHLLDPRTGAPARSGLDQVTVAAATCREAEVAAKVALILGPQRGRAFLQARGLAGLLVGPDGAVTAGAWPARSGRAA
jgi:FAD:protein FMN transferase